MKTIPLIEKTCGLCGGKFIPREDVARLICYSEDCIRRYRDAKWRIAYEEHERQKAETRAKRLQEVEEAERKRSPKLGIKRKRQREVQELYERNQKAGYVYLMRSSNGYYKIGISKNVNNRLGGIKRQFPIQVEIIHYIACADQRKAEAFLHRKYFTKRVEYEWFDLDAQDIHWITSLRDYELDSVA